MSKTSSTLFVSSLIAIMFVAGCSSPFNKKRGVVFRGDWAFEINRTPWVGHPGNTDIPGMEAGKDDKKRKSICPVCKQEKGETSWKESLLGPLSGCKGKKCLCGNNPAGGTGPFGGNINITSYNPTVANTFPGAIGGGYPGAIPPGSLSLPPGAVVTPNGVLMPNGTILPHSFFFPQPNAAPGMGQLGTNPMQQQMGAGNVTAAQATQQGTGQVVQNQPQTQSAQNQQYTNGNVPNNSAVPQQQNTQSGSGTMMPPPPQTSPSPSTNDQTSLLLQQFQNNPSTGTPSQVMSQSAGTQPLGVQQVAPLPGNVMMQNGLSAAYAQTVAQSMQNSQNPMLINPAANQVVPGLSMTGGQAPGYPPIAYAPTGYSPGYAQQMSPSLAAANPTTVAANANGTSGSSSEESDEQEKNEKAASSQQVAQMPYPRFHPVPTHPVYQRSMGMAPNYAALQQMRGMGMSPYMQQQQMMQQQMLQQQMMQRNMGMGMTPGPMYSAQQPYYNPAQRGMMPGQLAGNYPAMSPQLMQQPNAAMQRATYVNRPVSTTPEDDENAVISASNRQAPLPTKSRVILANQQAEILQPSQPRISKTAQINVISTKKTK